MRLSERDGGTAEQAVEIRSTAQNPVPRQS